MDKSTEPTVSRLFGTILAVVVCTVSAAALAQGLPVAGKPEDLGFSTDRLDRLTARFQEEVDRGEIPGAVIEIARNGRIAYLHAFGFQDRDKKTPMHTDALFRLASLSKPLTSVAAMILAEEGKLDLSAPVAKYLPELSGLRVGVERTDPATGKRTLVTEPPGRPPTVQDLLRHTAGFISGSATSQSLVSQAYAQADTSDWQQTTAELVTKVTKLPLATQPGSTWDYSSLSIDVLGRVVEIASGSDLDRFIRERITGPLKLSATGFAVSDDNLARIANPQIDRTTSKLPPLFALYGAPSQRPRFLSGGVGMWSSVDDYIRFCQMILSGGVLDGVRLLSPKTIERMESDALPPGTAFGDSVRWLRDIAPTPEMGQSFGLGFGVRVAPGRSPFPGSVGDTYWFSILGPYFWIDPKEQLIVVMMTQLPFQQLAPTHALLRELVYQALIVSDAR